MKIYIIERDEPKYKPDPEILFNGMDAINKVRKEYDSLMKELNTSQEKSDAGHGFYGCYWNFVGDGYCGDALIEEECGDERWEWRITEHII